MTRQGIASTPVGYELPDWHQTAACKGQDRLFFIDPGQSQRAAKAKAICATCKHQQACLAYALTFKQEDDDYGIWGGTSPAERKQIRRQRRTAA